MKTTKQRNQEYYEANREREKARALQYYYENKEKIDKEAKKAYMAEYLKTYQRRKKTPEEMEQLRIARRERYATDMEYRERIKAKSREHNQRNHLAKRNRRLKSEFNITLEEYNSLLEKQNGQCAICGAQTPGASETNKRERSMYVDHNHTTGEVRGLLCQNCNFGIGHFRDNPTMLRKAADYLDSFSFGAT